MTTTTIGDALFTKTQQRVLGLLYGRPDRRFYANEIMRLAGMGRGTVRRELDRMLSAGLLVMEREGNQQFYRANPASPVFAELRSIVTKTFGVGEVLGQALQPLAGEIELAFIYGSMASGSEGPGSDIDLLVVGDCPFESLVARLYPCQEVLGREINPNLYNRNEFAQQVSERNSFIAQILEKPIVMILGREDDIRKPGQDTEADPTGPQ